MKNEKIIILTVLLICFLPLNNIYSQDEKTLSGKVLFGKGIPVPNVAVSIENTSLLPAYTDSSGYFELLVPSENKWLLVNPAHSYKEQRIFIENRESLDIYLVLNDNESGYDRINTHQGETEKRNVISSVSHLDESKLTNNGFFTVDQYLQGQVSGLYVINQGSSPTSAGYSYIRGGNSIYATNQPLYIVDGVILETGGVYETLISGFNYNPLSSISPEDVSSITVLKDASATAIYGMKGANGVIIVETLNPTENKTKINLTAHTGLVLKPKSMPVLNADQYRNYGNELLQSINFPEEEIQNYYPGLKIDENSENRFNYLHNTDWQEETFTNGNLTNVYLSILGGDAVAKYGVSFAFDKYNGIVDNSDFNRLSLRLVGDINVLPKLRMNINAYINNLSENSVESMTNPQVSPIYTAIAKPPILGAYKYDKEGNQTDQLVDPLEFGISNPQAISELYIGEIDNTRFMGTIGLEGDITSNILARTVFSINRNNITEQVYFPNIGFAPYENEEINNISKRTHNKLSSFYNNTFIEYSNGSRNSHDIYLTAGLRLNSFLLQSDLRTTKNLPENDAVNNLGNGTDIFRTTGGDTPSWSWVSTYVSGRYGFKNRYIAEATVSLDGSSKVGKEAKDMLVINDQPVGLFYSVGAAWRLSEEAFLRNSSILDELKVRASYSLSGNDDIGTYNALDYYKQLRYREVTGIVPGRTANLALKNETMTMINFGLDMAFWGEKLTLTANLFQNTTQDLFLETTTEKWIWDDLLARNSGSSTSTGVEIEAGVFFTIGNSFIVKSNLNVTKVSSKINDIYNDQVVIPIVGGEMLYGSGMAYPQFYGYEYNGVYATTEDAQAANLINDENIPFQAGDAIYTDISGPDGIPDGKISDYDKTVLGSPFPDLYGGMFNQLIYKRWALDINFQFVYGNNIYNYKRSVSESMLDFSNQSLHVEQRWRQEGDQTNIPRALLNDRIGNSDFSSRWMEDGSYMRLKSLGLRYKIPEKFIVFQNAEFYLTGTNLFTFTNYLGDPEVGTGYLNYTQGIDYGLLPNARTIILGVKLGL